MSAHSDSCKNTSSRFEKSLPSDEYQSTTSSDTSMFPMISPTSRGSNRTRAGDGADVLVK
jgi:hypothetical protein